MTQVTVRRVEESIVANAKAVAKARGVSMNTILVEALREKFTDITEPKSNGLERFAGSLPDQSASESAYWDKFLNDDLNQIHPDDWK